MDEHEVIKLVEKITTTGNPELDVSLLKLIKKVCKGNDSILSPIFSAIMKQLRRKHSEIRLSSFQLLAQLFERSHQFRLLTLDELFAILELTLETNNVLLPPPKSAARKLRSFSAETFHKWVKKYSSAYRKLEHGYNYLRQVKRVEFNDLEGRSAFERQREHERKLKMDNLWRERVKRVQSQIEENAAEIQDCLTQLQNCLELVMPSPENFLFGSDEQSGKNEGGGNDMQSHGILHAKTKICINLDDADFMEEIKETEDNRDILTNLREQYSIFSNKLFPMVKKWVVTCTKAGENSPSHLLRKAIDIKGGLHKPCGQCLECFEFSIHYFWFISDTLLVQ